VAVIGLGNVLLGDDGFGPYVVELLRAGWEFPDCVELIDAGTPGLGLVTYLCDRDAVILIDAIVATGPPGELRSYRGSDLAAMPPQPRVSPHDPAVQETLAIAALSDHVPQSVVLIGAIAAATEVGSGLTAPLRAAARAAADLVVGEVARHAPAPRRRAHVPPPDNWWTRSPLPVAAPIR